MRLPVVSLQISDRVVRVSKVSNDLRDIGETSFPLNLKPQTLNSKPLMSSCSFARQFSERPDYADNG